MKDIRKRAVARQGACRDCGSGPHDNWLNCFALPGEDCPGMQIVVIDRRPALSGYFWKFVSTLIHRLKPTLSKRPVAFRVKAPSGWMYFEDEDTARRIAADEDYQGLYVRDGDA